MTLREAKRVLAVLLLADRPKPTHISELLDAFVERFPEFDWRFDVATGVPTLYRASSTKGGGK